MKHFLIRVAQRLLALSLLSASLAVAETAPDLTAAREAAAQVMPKLQAGSWQSSEAAFQTINQLAVSKEKADKELSEKLVGLCATALERGLQNLPPPPEQERLLRDAEAFADSLLRNPTAFNVKHARAVVVAWEKAQPDHPGLRLLRLRLHVVDKKRAEQIKLSSALMDEKGLDQGNREYVRDVYISALLRGRPSSSEELQQAEVALTRWVKEAPKHLRARVLLLELHHARQHWEAQYALATELLADENLTGADRKWVHHSRIEGSLKTGKTHELNEQDWNFMLERITGGKKLKAFIDKHGQLLLGIAFGIGWLWLLIVAFITRCVRAAPPRFWMLVLWTTIILYGSTVILAPLALCIAFSLLGIGFLIFGITGGKVPLGYLVPPQAGNESGRARWRGILGWCVLAFVIIQVFNQGYAWAFERVMGRALESQLVAKLLQTDTLPKLVGMVLAGGIFVPFLEEVVFRGILQDWIGRRLSAGWCVAIVSILFGLVHGLEMAIPIAFIGMLLSFLRLRYRSLWPCIILHSLNNSVMIILLHFFPAEVL